MDSDRFDRFLPFAGVLAGLLLAAGLALTYSIPNSETAPAETFAWWRDNRGQHQISGLLLAPLVALMLVFFGAGLKRSLRHNGHDSEHGSVAFGGAILGAGGFALIGMLEGAATSAAQEGQREAVYALSQLHSYDWLTFNASWAAVLLATGLGARRNGMLPTARLGDDRHRSITADADRFLRVSPHPSVAHRGRTMALPRYSCGRVASSRITSRARVRSTGERMTASRAAIRFTSSTPHIPVRRDEEGKAKYSQPSRR